MLQSRVIHVSLGCLLSRLPHCGFDGPLDVATNAGAGLCMDAPPAAPVAGGAHTGARAAAAAVGAHADRRLAAVMAGSLPMGGHAPVPVTRSLHASAPTPGATASSMPADRFPAAAMYRGSDIRAPAAAASGLDELAASTWLLPAGVCQIPDALRHGHALDLGSAPGGAAGAGFGSRGAHAQPPAPDQALRAERARAGAAAGRSGAPGVRSDRQQRAAGAEQSAAAQGGQRRAINPQEGFGPSAACGRVRRVRREQAANGRGCGAAGAAARVQRGVTVKAPRQGLGYTGDMCPGHAPSREMDQRAGARKRSGLQQGAAASRGWAR